MNIGNIAASAMNAFAVDMMVRANNVANLNTPGFHAQDIVLTTGPHGEGVAVGGIFHNATLDVPIPGVAMADANGREVLEPGYVQGSNVDVAHEFAHMMTNQRVYEANASIMRTYDALAGTVLDIKV